MASIVSCPSCQKRLKIGTDKPGGKLRCPGCNTPFVLGSRINADAGGPIEFQAFELFEDNIVTDMFSVEEDRPAALPKSALKPASKSASGVRPTSPSKIQPKPAPKPVPPPAPVPPPVAPAKALLPDDMDLLGEGPMPSKSTSIPMPIQPAKPTFIPTAMEPEPDIEPVPREPDLPENFALHDEHAGLWGAGEWAALPKSEQPIMREAVVRARKAAAKPQTAPAPPPIVTTDFFLPADFDPFAVGPLRSADGWPLGDEIPGLKEEEPNFEVVDDVLRHTAEGVPIIEGATAEEIAAAQQWEQVQGEPQDRAKRREFRRRRARSHRVSSDVRGRWVVVHWGLTVQVIGLALMLAAAAVGAFSFFLALVHGFAAAALLAVIMAGLLALREMSNLLSYALGVAAPARNNAWLWSALAILFTFSTVAGLILIAILPMFWVSIVMTTVMMGWFCYILYLRALGEALRIEYIVTECGDLMKMLGLTLAGVIAFNVFMVGYFYIVRPGNSLTDLIGTGYVMLTCGLVFQIYLLIMGGVCVYKFYFIVTNLRQEIGWRLES